MNNVPVYKLRLARTLYNNFYRARLTAASFRKMRPSPTPIFW